jgi:hypothetical protein
VQWAFAVLGLFGCATADRGQAPGEDAGNPCREPLVACAGGCVDACPVSQRLTPDCGCEDLCPEGTVFVVDHCEMAQNDGGPDSDTDVDTDADTDVDADTDADADTDSDTGTGEEDLRDPDNLCLAAVGGGDAFCGVDCSDDGVCPAGFTCTSIIGPGHPPDMCAPTDGSCAGEVAPDPLCDPCIGDASCR